MTENNSIKKIISDIKSELKETYPIEEINSLIYLIFEDVLDYSRTKLLMSPEVEISDTNIMRIKDIVNDLKNQKPIQHILQKTIFYDLPFKVTQDALIPRPETEELVDWVISDHKEESLNILDIGTGTGCIAISIAKNLPQSKVYAMDISSKALELARENGKLNNTDIVFLESDILKKSIEIEEKFDIIVSNPPYIRQKEKEFMSKNVLEYEPELALFVPDNDPLLFYKTIIDFGLKNLNKEGKIYFEINEAFGQEMINLFEVNNFSEITLKKDINGKHRMIKGKLF